MPDIKLLDKEGKAIELSTIDRIEAIKIAIDYRDPKLVQLLLGARYCLLWQYWLVRAIFNYDMLSLIRIAKCEFPLAISNELLRYLADKERIDDKELNSILVDKKIKYCQKMKEFYGNDRISELHCIPEGVQLESVTGESLAESMSNQVAGGHQKTYHDYNKDCSVSDSLTAAINTNYSQEFITMMDETIMKCKQEIKDAEGATSNLKDTLREKKAQLESRKEELSLKISTVIDNIIKKMQDNKFIDKGFVHSEYNKLLDYYFQSLNYAGQGQENPLRKCIESEEMINEAKNSLKKSSMYYGFGDCIDYAAQKVRNTKNAEQKEAYLNIIRVLAVNGAHSESLIHTFDTVELRMVAQQSIFTVAKKAYEVLFDFDRCDEAKFMSKHVGEDGEFPDPVNPNVRILESSGSPIVKVILDKLRVVEGELQHRRIRGKANRETGLFNAIYYLFSDLFRRKYEPQSKEEHARVYRTLYEALDIIYLDMATGDDRVLIDYAEEIKSRIKNESNRDMVSVYSVLYSLFNAYRESRENIAVDTSRWQRVWYHFQDIFRRYNNDVESSRMIRHLRTAMYVTEKISEEYAERQRQRFTTTFRNIDVTFLPGNCLINWLAATKEGVLKSDKENNEQKDKDLEEATQKRKQADVSAKQQAQRAEQEALRADKLELQCTVIKLIMRSFRKLNFDPELRNIIEDGEDDIVKEVVEHVMRHKSSPGQVLDSIMQTIQHNEVQIKTKGKIDDKLIEKAIEPFVTTVKAELSVNMEENQEQL